MMLVVVVARLMRLRALLLLLLLVLVLIVRAGEQLCNFIVGQIEQQSRLALLVKRIVRTGHQHDSR